jgi:hypothetical protein
MRAARKIARPRLLVLLGFGSATTGAVISSLFTFQTQAQVPGSSSFSGPGSITLTFTNQSLDPAAAALLVLIMAIPVWAGYLHWRFYLATLVAPALVALGVVEWIYQLLFAPLATSIVLSSALWAFLGVALVLLGCALEIAGVVLTRRIRGDAPGDRSPGTRAPRYARSPPR